MKTNNGEDPSLYWSWWWGYHKHTCCKHTIICVFHTTGLISQLGSLNEYVFIQKSIIYLSFGSSTCGDEFDDDFGALPSWSKWVFSSIKEATETCQSRSRFNQADISALDTLRLNAVQEKRYIPLGGHSWKTRWKFGSYLLDKIIKWIKRKTYNLSKDHKQFVHNFSLLF